MNKKYDTHSTTDLINMAYKETCDDTYWDMISELRTRGSETEFEAARNLTLSDDPVNRQIGAQILAQLGYGKDVFHNESVDILISLLDDKNEDVIEVAAFSLGHRHNVRAIHHLLKHVNHQNNLIRFGVAFGLSGLENMDAAEGLIKLCRDKDFDTRNWATFGLGQQCELDNTDIREALRENLSDSSPEIRGEALIGLALRKDSCIKDAIIKELNDEFHGIWVVEAAEAIADPDYIPLLEKIKAEQKDKIPDYMMTCIDDAIDACSKKQSKVSGAGR